MKQEYRAPNVMPTEDRPKDEQQAIHRYCETAHQTNVPQNLDFAKWDFTACRKAGKLIAGLF